MDMEEWGQEDIDLVVPGYITFTEDRLGAFQFGTVEGSLDYHIEPYGNGERLVFSWEGSDDMDPVRGRGWVMIKEGQLHGQLYFHDGDDSGVIAVKQG